MSLYEYSLFNIFNQINNNIIKYEDLENLPEDILNDLDIYLIHIDESYGNFLEIAFYTSLKLKHLVFTKYFLDQIILIFDNDDVIDIINKGLYYVTDIISTNFLIQYNANDWNEGLLGSVDNNNIIMIEFFIKLGADEFDDALIKSVLKNNIKLINYFIALGADDFDDSLAAATQINNMKLIDFFIKKGARDFDGGLYVAARFGLDNLIAFYINLGANDYMTVLGGAIDNNHFNDLLIPYIENYKIHPLIVGKAFLYFLKNTNFETISGNSINNLIPYLLDGYATKQTLELILRLYSLNNNFNENYQKNSTYYIAFGKIPSLNKKVKKNKKIIIELNDSETSTFDNIKKHHPGFYPNFIDRIYFSDIIELNVFKNNELSKKEQLFLMNDETSKQLWKELTIIKAVVDFYH